MNLSQIEYFLAVAEQLNFTGAAKSLYVSQPALSKQIAMLEEELGTKLFVRNSRKVSLTDAGRKFEQDLKEIHLSLENAKKNVMENGRQEQRTVRIGCFDGVVIRDFLPKFYRHIQENAPILQTTLVRGRFEENRLALEEDRIDILFTLDIEFPGGSEYKTQQLIRRNGALIYARELIDKEEEEVEIRDFQDIPLLLMRKSLAPKLYENELNNLKKIGIENPKILEVENMATLRAHLEMGLGYSVLTADVDIGSKMQKYLLPEENGTWVIAVWKKDRPDIDALMDGLQM